MAKRPMTDVAYDYLSGRKTAVPFLKLFDEVAKVNEISENLLKKKKSQFYSALSLDNRFVSMPGNKWDLKRHHKYDETRVAVEEIDDEDVEIEDVSEDMSKTAEEYN